MAMTNCRVIQTPLGLADDLRAAIKNKTVLAEALLAITARIEGDYDSAALRKRGPLQTHMLNDIHQWAREALMETGIKR
jgi:hypothetical protein